MASGDGVHLGRVQGSTYLYWAYNKQEQAENILGLVVGPRHQDAAARHEAIEQVLQLAVTVITNDDSIL